MPATANSKSRSSAACGIAPPGDMVDGDTSIGLLRGFSAGFFEALVVRLFTKKPIAELAKMTSTPPTEPYRAISHRLLLGLPRSYPLVIGQSLHRRPFFLLLLLAQLLA